MGKNGQKENNIQMVRMHIKRGLSFVKRKVQIKTTAITHQD